MNLPMIRRVQTPFIAGVVLFLFTPLLCAQSDVKSIYMSKCASCHGADGKGATFMGKQTGARDFASPEVRKETDDQLIEITARGKKKMPGYEKSLKSSQIKDLVTYSRELAKRNNIPPRSPDRSSPNPKNLGDLGME